MNKAVGPNKAGRRPGFPVRTFISKVSAIVAECAYAQRRMTELATAPDRYLADPDTPPQTYSEFLYRTSGLLHREPSARARSRAG